MSEFEKELAESKNVEYAVDEVDKDNAGAELVLNTIAEEFKDWQPPKQLVEVQKCVADWFENNKDNLEIGIYNYCLELEFGLCNDFADWFSENDNKPIETLIRMKLEGYTVKKQEFYEIYFGFGYLIQNIKNKNMVFVNSSPLNFDNLKSKFTEKEIKELDERYWAFAVEVDEVEE